MIVKLSWLRQKVKRLLKIIGILAACALIIVLIAVIIEGYLFNWDWTGLSAYAPPTKASTFQRGKTLWDWLQLLIIPVVLAIGGYLFNLATNRNQQVLASDNQREDALQTYLDKMSDLLLTKGLRESDSDAEVRKIARVRTVTILPRLDKRRKGSVLQFLYESGLVARDNRIIDLKGADFANASLQGANLSNANLQWMNLSNADLEGADLSNTDLQNANLSNANLRSNLRGAILLSTNLHKANLRNADLIGAWLLSADLSGANLSGANLSGANLNEANVSGANLRNAWLSGTILQRADLSRANLSRANLSQADLCDANLSRANLSRAFILESEGGLSAAPGVSIPLYSKLATEQVSTAKSLKGAIMPDRKRHS